MLVKLVVRYGHLQLYKITLSIVVTYCCIEACHGHLVRDIVVWSLVVIYCQIKKPDLVIDRCPTLSCNSKLFTNGINIVI
jgi:hypothetical protein